jgi:hypothetical protein
MIVIDFKLPVLFGQNTFIKILKGLANARWTDCFLATDRLSAKTPVRQMCSSISRQLQDTNLFMFRSISLHGVRTDNLSSKSSRHRNLSACDAAKALPLRHPRKRFSDHACKGKRKSGLANLRRVCTRAYENYVAKRKTPVS